MQGLIRGVHGITVSAPTIHKRLQEASLISRKPAISTFLNRAQSGTPLAGSLLKPLTLDSAQLEASSVYG